MGSRWCMVVVAGALTAGALLAGCGGSNEELTPAPPASSGPAETEATVRSGVQGTVTDPSGAPVAAATISRVSLDDVGPVTQEAAVTGPDGHWAWSLRPGTWDLTASAPGYRPATGRVVVAVGERATLDLVLFPG